MLSRMNHSRMCSPLYKNTVFKVGSYLTNIENAQIVRRDETRNRNSFFFAEEVIIVVIRLCHPRSQSKLTSTRLKEFLFLIQETE